MDKIKIVFDVDGVLLNYGQALHNFLVKHYSLEPKLEYSTKQWFMKGRFEPEVISQFGFKNIEKDFEKAGLFKSIEAMPEIELAHSILSSNQYNVYFVTSISEHLHSNRLYNLQKIVHADIRPEQLICVTPPASKKPIIDKIKPHFFIEDSLNNLAECFGEHHSIWINLNERQDAYDLNHLTQFNIHEVSNFNQIKEKLEMLMIENSKVKTTKNKI